MRSMLRVLTAASLLVAASACQKAEFEKVSPEALIMSLSTGVVSADDASLTVSVQAVDDGVAVLEEDILFTIGGTCVAAPQTVPTDPSSGLAIATFAGLDAAGACTVTAATLGDVTATADFQVVAGAPATLTFVNIGQIDILAGEEVTFSVSILDSALNPVALAADVTTDSPGAIFSATGITYEEAGTFSILASLDGFPALSDSIDVTVAPDSAAQVTTALLQTSVGQQQELLVTCTELDAFGNVRPDPFDSTEVTTAPAAGSITEDGTVAGLFHISGFSTFGVYVVTCVNLALSDDKTFAVVQQGGANSVVASANLTLVEAGTGTLTVTCTEVDQFGNDVGTQFNPGTGFVTTASGVALAEPSPNVFTATGITAKGVFAATCSNGTDSDSELYTVGDSTAPTETAFTVTGGTGPYAAGTTVTVNLDVQDVIGVANESLVLVSGPGVITSPATILETTADPPSRSFQLRLDGTVGSASTVVVRGLAADTTGNLRATASTLSIAVDPAPTAVITTLSASTVEAGTGTLTVTCKEVDSFGNDVGTAFDLPAGFTTTAPGAMLAEPTPNVFTATGITATGDFTATCDTGTVSSSKTFTARDTTAPAETAFSVTGGTGPYASGTTVTVNLDVLDVIGVASESLVLVSGPGVITSPATILETTANPPSRSFQVRLDGTVGSSSTVVVRGQAADTTGNLGTTASTLAITVNAASTVVTASASPSTVEAGSTLTVSCTEKHAVTGSNAATAWAGGDVTTTASGELIAAPSGNQFAVTNLLTKGTFTATCTGDFNSGDATFAVADTTPPSAATSLNPAAGPYAANTNLQVTVTASDTVGLASASIEVVSGPGTLVSSPSVALNGATSAAPVFTVRLDGSTTAASTVVLRTQVTDTTGNIRQPSDISADVNQATAVVVTTLAGSSVEHNQTLDFTCKELNFETGADTNRTFNLTNVSTTAPGGTLSMPGANAFRITGPFTSKGNFTATCTMSAQSDIETFSIFDATAPTIGTLSVVSGTLDDAYAPGQNLTIRLSAAGDGIGLARTELSLTGSAQVNQPNPRFTTGTAVTNVDFTITVDTDAATFSSIVLTAQATDTTGNTVTSATKTLTVDPAVGMAVDTGITMRTLFESVGTPIPTGIGTDGTDLFLQRQNGSGFIQDVARVSGTTGPANLTSVISSGFPGSTTPTGGITALSTAFGGRTIFHTLDGTTPQIGADNGTVHANFDPTPSNFVDPLDVSFGNLGNGDKVWTIDTNGGGNVTVFKSISTGEVAPFYIGTAGQLASCIALTKDPDPTTPRLLVPNPTGAIHTLVDGGGDTGVFATLSLTGSIPANDAKDIAVGGAKILIAGGATGAVYRVNVTTVQNPISSAFDAPIGVAVKANDGNSLHVLDVGALPGGYRIYKVTGY